MVHTKTDDAFRIKEHEPPSLGLIIIISAGAAILTVAWLGLLGWGASKLASWFFGMLANLR